MPDNARCAVAFYCDNDKRYPDYIVKRSHDKTLAEIWRKQVAKSRSDSFNPALGTKGTYVCSNHFPQGKRTPSNPETDYPSVFMTVSEHLKSSTPKKRKRNQLQERERSPSPKHKRKLDESEDEPSENSDTCEDDPAVYLPMRFEQLTRKSDVRFYNGLPSTEAFRCLMKLRLALLLEDLAFRFQISSRSASSIFITWVKLCSKEFIVNSDHLAKSPSIKLRKHCLAALERYTPKFGVSSTVLNALLQHRVVWISLQQCGVNTSTIIPSRCWLPSHQTVQFPMYLLPMER